MAILISNVQNFNLLEIKMPTFKDEFTSNPVEFLEELEKVFRIKNVKEEKKMLIV